MEYRNAGNATHHTKGMVFGTDSNVGVEVKGSTILSASDSAASGLTVRAKGVGALALGDSSNGVNINGSTVTITGATAFRVGTSTSNFGGMNRGTSTMTLVELPVSALVCSTVTIQGLGVNDLLYLARPGDTLVSTAIGMVGYTCTAANEAKVAWLNNLASTASILGDTPIKFAYIKA